jgi:PAS domain S-box-containing protein
MSCAALRVRLTEQRTYQITDAVGPVQRVIGLTPDELLGPLSNWVDRIHPRDRPPADKLLPTSVGTSTELHCCVSAPDGDWMIRRHKATRVAQDDLHILVWESAEATVGPDATEISEELQRFEKRYQAVFEASLDPLFLVDEAGHLLEVSQGVREILGWEPHEALGDHFGDYMGDDDMPQMLELWRRVIAGESLRAQVDLVHRDGAEIPTEISATRVELDGATHVVAVLRDLRETMELRSALDKVEKRLARAEKLELVGQLAGGIAHDIQNMLAVITGSARMLKDEATNDTLRGDAEAILTASKTASRLTRQLLEFGTPSTDTPRVHLDELLDSLEPLFSRLLPKTVRFDVDIEPDLPALDMRSIELEQLLVNLLINAADAVGSSGHIRLRANATGSPEYVVRVGHVHSLNVDAPGILTRRADVDAIRADDRRIERRHIELDLTRLVVDILDLDSERVRDVLHHGLLLQTQTRLWERAGQLDICRYLPRNGLVAAGDSGNELPRQGVRESFSAAARDLADLLGASSSAVEGRPRRCRELLDRTPGDDLHVERDGRVVGPVARLDLDRRPPR